MKRILSLLYGIACYIVLLVTVFYAMNFTGNSMVPRTMDGSPAMPFASAVLINVSLLLLWTFRHRFISLVVYKRRWQSIPAQLERSSHVLLSCLLLLFLMWCWQPTGGVVWYVEDKVGQVLLRIAYLSGWSVVFTSTFLINHFDLFGLRQAWFYFTGKRYPSLVPGGPDLNRLVRHPFYLGFLVLLWSAPLMTILHLVLAVLATGYVIAAIYFENKTIVVPFLRRIRVL